MVDVRVSGVQRANRRLQITRRETVRNVSKALFVAGDIIKVEAQNSITQGAVSGANHVPSAPGQPPNEDTGNLRRNIRVIQTGPLTVQIVSFADYSAFLEFGTSNMLARPFMGPAARKKTNEVVALVRRAAAT